MKMQARRCRHCDQGLAPVLNLGLLALSDFPPIGATAQRAAPLDLMQCRTCGLVQLRYTVEPDALFRRYWYQSGINETMRAELQSVVEQAVEIVPVGGAQVVLDVGANDGTLLEAYATIGRNPFRVAVEPADNLRPLLKPRCEQVWDCYFPDEALVRGFRGRVHILTSIACFYTADDPHAFAEAVYQLLAPGGVWIVQFQDLHQMLQSTAFDNLCHEHLIYYSLESFERVIGRHGLRVVHAERRAINGGSLRLIVQRTGEGSYRGTVASTREVESGCEHWRSLDAFAQRVEDRRQQILAIVESVRSRQRVIDLYGASTKANTLLQVCGLGPTQIRQAWDRSEVKWGCTTVTGVPIVPEAHGRMDPPDLLLVGIWQFREAILRREREYLDQGGALLFPLPVVDLVRLEEETP